MVQPRFAPITRSIVTVAGVAVIVALFIAAFLTPSFELTHLALSPVVVLSAVVVVINIALIVYMLTRPARNEERTWLMLYQVTLTCYAIAALFQQLSRTPQAALFWVVFSSL